VRFDIGFIGRGNPEISLDKVTRFQQAEVLGGESFYMATIIIVDRIGSNSRIVEMAQTAHGTIIQMSATYWPQEVARLLHSTFGFEHELINMDQVNIGDYLKRKLQDIPLESFMRSLPSIVSDVEDISTEESELTNEEDS
jgi:hypothetical protein